MMKPLVQDCRASQTGNRRGMVAIARPRSAIPAATYRLQLHSGFTFDDAAKRITYFRDLGITHLYLSPIQTARAGSMHGYDVIDHRTINAELGGEAQLRCLARACHAQGLGIIVDIVPNHMAVGGADNVMWLDVLEKGRGSQFAHVFDIEFGSDLAGAGGKIILPVLGETYGEALESHKLSLIWDAAIEKLTFAYGPHRFPLRQKDYAEIAGAGEPSAADLSKWNGAEQLHVLLERQNFRLILWSAGGDVINWRRFFDVNELAGLRMEDERVFNLTHAVLARLYEDGVIDGVRVDHIDGLADPAAYAIRLRHLLESCNGQRPGDAPKDGPYIVVEKILGHGESLSTDWRVNGTSGYDFMNAVSALQHDQAGAAALDDLWHRISGRPETFGSEETLARREILRTAFAGQLAGCADGFATLAQAQIATRDLTAESFRRIIVAMISHLRAYRSYATGLSSGPLDDAFQSAMNLAKEELPADAASAEFVAGVLAGEGGESVELRVDVVRRLNQLTAPVAAKAVEDTAFYRYSRLLSRNDVGFEAGRLSMSPGEFLSEGSARATTWPFAMLTTATHDHKRGEDVRARLAVISEIPNAWREVVDAWFVDTAAGRPECIAPDDVYSLWQTLVGAWPLYLEADDAAGLHQFCERVAGWREKSLREAKLRSSWAAPDADYEAANREWLTSLLDPARSAEFLVSLVGFVRRIAPAGAVNSLVQTALRCTWPGVPDLYQGGELWDFSLVDPDNRRPVDFDLRQRLLDQGLEEWQSGGVKLSLIATMLQARAACSCLFTSGGIESLQARGARIDHILAFRRFTGGKTAEIAVMLRVAEACSTLGVMPAADWWGDTEVQIGGAWRRAVDLFVDRPVFLRFGAEAP